MVTGSDDARLQGIARQYAARYNRYLIHYLRSHDEPDQAMQPTTLWRCVPTRTLARMLGMEQNAPARVVADLGSR